MEEESILINNTLANGFQILNYDEEKRLSDEEKIEYYKKLKYHLSCGNNAKKILSYAQKCEKHNWFTKKHIDKLIKYDLEVENQFLIPTNTPIIYASSHQDFYDHINIIKAIPGHAIILNSCEIPWYIKMVLNFNGVELVDRQSTQSRFNSKNNLMGYLANGKSIVIFPEGTYNCSPNRLLLPLKSGTIDIAKKMQVPIIPTVQFYNHDTTKMDGKNKVISCKVKFGNPIYVDYNDEIKDKKRELRDSMAYMIYEEIEKKGNYSRTTISPLEYQSYVQSRIATIKKMGVNYEHEVATIYGADDYTYIDYPINAVSIEPITRTKKRKN